MKWSLAIYLIPLVFRKNFDLNPIKKYSPFKRANPAWISLVLWTVTYFLAAAFALLHARTETPGLVAALGWLTLLGGIFIRRSAYKELSQYYHPAVGTFKDHKVVDSGIYQYLRHPLHLGLFFEITGWCLMAESLWVGTIVLIAFANTIHRNRIEEKELRLALGKPYTEFAERTWDVIDLLR